MDFSTDKKEIIDLVNATTKEQKYNFPIDQIITRITKPIGEQYLDDRAAYLKKSSKLDGEFAATLSMLDCICDDSKQSCCKTCSINKYCNTYILKMRSTAKNDSFKMADLFCGAGGLSLGFVQEGFAVALANDIEECCIDTYSHNHPEVPRDHIICGDIRGVVNNVAKLLDGEKIDIVVGGPPCQGFSMANRQRIIDDPRNMLYKNFVSVVNIVHPQFFVMENVKGMLKASNEVKEDFKNIGYDVECCILNAKDFGVPQNRERLIYIGNSIKTDNNRIFEEIKKLGQKTPNYVLKDALYGLRPLSASRSKNCTDKDSVESGFKIERNSAETDNAYVSLINQGRKIPVTMNHKARYNNERDIEIYGRLNQGDRADDPKIADIMPYASRNNIFKDKYFKLEENKVCKTITAHMKFDCNMYIHPTQSRGLTPREAARVQSYPDDYYFRGSYSKTYMQIGNSVPPLMARTIAKAVKKAMMGE